MQHDQDWFRMTKERKLKYDRAAWIPLYVDERNEQGEWPDPEYEDDYFGVSTMLLDTDDSAEIHCLHWFSVRPSSHRPGFDGDGFYSAKYYFGQVHGQFLVFPVSDEGKKAPRHVLIDPDLVLGLGLNLVGSDWVSFPDEGEVVIRQFTDSCGNVTKVEIRSEYLKDYLAAREMGLAVITLRERKQVFADCPGFQLAEENSTRELSWDGGIREIGEHGGSFGRTWKVSILGRHDVDADEDAPVAEVGANEGQVTHREFETKPGESKRFLVSSDLMKREWIAPAQSSPRVRGDERSESYCFVADAAATRMSTSELDGEPGWRWLTFRPESVSNLLNAGKVSLEWWSRQTGCIRYGDNSSIHFGLNSIGLVCIFSKDVIELAPHRQRHFSGHSVSPEGGGCEELIRAQMQSDPAGSSAPESRIVGVREKLDVCFKKHYGSPIFRPHSQVSGIAARSHRFMPSNVDGLYDLAKDLRRIFIEAIDEDFLIFLTPSCKKDLGSIKRICKLLDDAGQDGRSITAPLVGIHDLRQASAHLPRNSVDASFSLVRVNLDDPVIISAMNMIEAVVDSVDSIATALDVPPQ